MPRIYQQAKYGQNPTGSFRDILYMENPTDSLAYMNEQTEYNDVVEDHNNITT